MHGALREHVAAALKETDRDRYLTTLILPGNKRPYVQALFAFCADAAAIRSRVTEPTAGEIRLQWWTEAIEGQRPGEARQNPLAEALLETIAAFGLPAGSLVRLLGARRFDLYDDPMPDMATFEGYAGETASTPLHLAAMILNDGTPPENGDAAGHLGVAQALAGHMRAFGFHAAKGQIYLPVRSFADHGVTEQQILTGNVSPGLLAACAGLRQSARDHLQMARAAIAELPKPLRPAFAAIALVDAQLKALEKAAENPFIPPPELFDWQKIWRLLG